MYVLYVLQYFNDISQRLDTQRAKIYELVLFNNIFFNYFEVSLLVSFCFTQ